MILLAFCMKSHYNMIMATSNIQIRVDTELKENVEEILEKMGLDIRTAVRMLLKKIEDVRAIPFHVGEEIDENGFTPAQQKRIMKAYEESFDVENLEGPFYTAAEFIDSLE